MKFSSTILIASILYASSTIVSGNIVILNPFNAITWQSNSTETVTWKDDGKAPKLADWGNSVIVQLMTGNDQQIVADTIAKSVKPSALKADYTVRKDLGPAGPYYYIKISSTSNTSNIAYSGKFNIQGISGTIKGFDPNAPQSNPDNTTTSTDGTSKNNSTTSFTTSSPSSTSSPSANKLNSTSHASGATSNKVYTFTGFAVGVLGFALSYFS
ncbi:12001_t:CDS:2 [Ambispora leptoticha]|uniref:12001_t:CDS:1 n=1 Tax=Ambispora leptoticha TaxID=144679 RepID=A0A9N8VFT1_9GLOM|nr:12001_t:CDS:2 [Ambispora leptoticha]